MDTKTRLVYIYYLQETLVRARETYRLRVREQGMVFHTNRNQNKAGEGMPFSEKLDFKTNTVMREKKGPTQ